MAMHKAVDRIIVGAGMYGLYAAWHCGKKGLKTVVLEYEQEPFMRATYINQARVHNGYHYPRSYSTAKKSAQYFERFHKDFGFCIHEEFEKIYATSRHFSWANAAQFSKFCDAAGIPCIPVSPTLYFQDKMCDGVFRTREFTYDAKLLRDFFVAELKVMPHVEICYGARISGIKADDKMARLSLQDGADFEAPLLLNATYASVNQILNWIGEEPFRIKYELCEIILCKASDKLRDVGITVMDGPFFSIMPFGKTGLHSLTAVSFTPHKSVQGPLPHFTCQKDSGGQCTPEQFGNCNHCPAKPKSAWPYMEKLARKYLREEFDFTYVNSLYSIKPILLASEVDDSRPTVIRVAKNAATVLSVLSGKINTMYDLDEYL